MSGPSNLNCLTKLGFRVLTSAWRNMLAYVPVIQSAHKLKLLPSKIRTFVTWKEVVIIQVARSSYAVTHFALVSAIVSNQVRISRFQVCLGCVWFQTTNSNRIEPGSDFCIVRSGYAETGSSNTVQSGGDIPIARPGCAVTHFPLVWALGCNQVGFPSDKVWLGSAWFQSSNVNRVWPDGDFKMQGFDWAVKQVVINKLQGLAML